jgi:RNA polymerase sigma-70 factor (ECF subfamily)
MKDTLLICSYREYLINYLSKRFLNARKEDIEDAVQNAIIKALRLSNSWKGDSSLKTWLSVIALNMYLDTFRKTYVKHEYTLNSSEESFIFDKIPVDDFSETLCDIDYQNKLFKELLNGFEDNIFIKTLSMHIVDDMDYKNIAIQLDIPLGTVKGRIFRAKKLLQEKYRKISHKYQESTV